jgi:outer membrane receptor for ferrienterochelin and colicin
MEFSRHHFLICIKPLAVAALILTLQGYFTGANAQYIIHGIVYDRNTGEYLVAATVYDELSKAGTVTNEYGFYSLRTSGSQVVLRVSYVGYSAYTADLSLQSDTVLTINLDPDLEIAEVTITAHSSDREFRSSQMSAHNISRLETSKMPLLLGEADLIKALQYLPGVSSGLEGTSGIYVRGGGSDQNLVLLDGVPVYNVNHLFGIFSVFNGDAINSATIYKGGFPARYSGRLSSVLDIRMKEGNMIEFHGSSSIGIISSKMMLEGPIIRDKTSFLISGRRTYADILSYPVQYLVNKRRGYPTDSYFGYYFHDLNAKINHRFSDRNRLYLSYYSGKDEFYLKDEYLIEDGNTQETFESHVKEGFNWKNRTAAFRWNYIWNRRLFSNITLSYSTYRFTDFEEYSTLADYTGTGSFSGQPSHSEYYYSGIRDLSGRGDFHFAPSNRHSIRFGAAATAYMFEPGVRINEYYSQQYGMFLEKGGADTVRGRQLTAYMEDDFHLGEHFSANVGISSTLFHVSGQNYYTIEPRISARYLINDRLVVKASGARMSQFLHLLTNSTVGLPTDVWVPTTSLISPEESWQGAAGIQYKWKPGIKVSAEAFYKEMRNVVEYAEGEEIYLNDSNWESRIISGNGTVYGLEFLTEKTGGRVSGSLAYTLSKNTRTFDEVNKGESFPYKYDRRHDLSLTAACQVNERISLSGVWVFASGINITILSQSYYDPSQLFGYDPENGREFYDNDIIRNFEERNGYKLPAYHRLDLGVNLEKKKKRVNRTLSIGAYNVYSRKNAFYIYNEYGKYHDTGQWEKRIYQVTLLPFIPYIKYSIRF